MNPLIQFFEETDSTEAFTREGFDPDTLESWFKERGFSAEEAVAFALDICSASPFPRSLVATVAGPSFVIGFAYGICWAEYREEKRRTLEELVS